MAIGDGEREHILLNEALKPYHTLLHQSRKHAEGNRVQFDILDEKEYAGARDFIIRIIGFRKMIR